MSTQSTWLLDVHTNMPIEELARRMSGINRFNNASPRAYSVAKHAIVVMKLLPSDASYNAQKMAMMHDAHEAYIGDLSRPVKQAFGSRWAALEESHDDIIFARYGVEMNAADRVAVSAADNLANRIEVATLGLLWPDDVGDVMRANFSLTHVNESSMRMICKLICRGANPKYDANEWLWWWNDLAVRQVYRPLRPVPEGEP